MNSVASVCFEKGATISPQPSSHPKRGQSDYPFETKAQKSNAYSLWPLFRPATRKAFTLAKVFPGASVFGRFLTALGKARLGLGQHAAAEANLLEASSIPVQFPGLFPRDKRECTQAIVDLYTAWQTAEPGKGYDAKATEWKRKLDELDAANPAPVAPKP